MEANIENSHKDTLEALTGISLKTKPIQGEVVTINPVVFRNIPKLIQVVSPLMDDIKEFKLNTVKGNVMPPELIDKLQTFLVEKQDDVALALGLMARKDPEWVLECNADEVTDLFVKCVAVNIDFFIKKLLPSYAQHLPLLQKAFSLVGSTKYNSLLPQGTGTKTS